MYLLDGGYRSFYKDHPEHCDGAYVEMRDKLHSSGGDDSLCEGALDQSRKSWKRHKSTDFSDISRVSSSSF